MSANNSRRGIPARGGGRGMSRRGRGAAHGDPASSSRGGSPSAGGGRGGRSGKHGNRGRGNTQGRWRDKKDILDGLGTDPLHIFEKPPRDIEVKGVEFHASYSWLEAPAPTIAIPGSPRIWLDLALPFSVSPDRGKTFDQNAHRIPEYSMLPLFVAVDITEGRLNRPRLDWKNLDFITDRNNLLKLAGYVHPAIHRKQKKPLRIDIDLLGSRTVLMHRWEERDSVSSDNTGFGDSFERKSTTPGPGCEGATLAGHARIISYDLGGLRMLVRCEADACYPPDSTQPGEGLADELSSLNIVEPPTPRDVGGLKVVFAGREVQQSELIKIKTISSHKVFYWPPAYLQLLLGDTPTHIVGMHTGGEFFEYTKRRLRTAEFELDKLKVQSALNLLGELLLDIHAAVLEQGQGTKLSLIVREGTLKLVKRTDERRVPAYVLNRFQTSSEFVSLRIL